MLEPIIVDVETYWDSELTLKKLTTTEYNSDPRTRPYSIGVTEHSGNTEVAWGEDIPTLLADYHYTQRTVFAYNARFDLQNIKIHYDLLPRYGVCLLDLLYYRYPLARKHISLDVVAEKLGFPPKDTGDGAAKNLGGMTGEQIRAQHGAAAEYYVKMDAWLAAKLLRHLLYDFTHPVPQAQWFSMFWAVRQFIDPIIELDEPVLVAEVSRIEQRRQHLLQKSGMTLDELRSDTKFREALENLGCTIPRKMGGGKTPKPIPEFAKTDPFMLGAALRNDAVGTLVAARVECNSSTNITRAKKYIKVGQALNGKWPVHLVASGAKTHRVTGGDGGGGNPLNLQRGAPIRSALVAPKGFKFLGFDFSKFELGIARWIARDERTKQSILAGVDPYIDIACEMYRVPENEITPHQRQVGKAAELSAQYGVGYATLHKKMRAEGIEAKIEEAQTIVQLFRTVKSPAVVHAWNVCDTMIKTQWRINPGQNINLPGKPVPHEGWLWPSGRVLVMRNIKEAYGDLVCYNGLPFEGHADKMYGGKVYQRFCQSMANELLQEKKMLLERAGFRICLEVYDELVACVPDTADMREHVERITEITTRPVDWWDDAPPLSIGEVVPVDNYLECK